MSGFSLALKVRFPVGRNGLLGTTFPSSGGGQSRLQSGLRQVYATRKLQFDEAAETALFLRLMIGENVGQIMVEERVPESLEDGASIGLRFRPEPDLGEHRKHPAVVEIVELLRAAGPREPLAHRRRFVGAARRPAFCKI